MVTTTRKRELGGFNRTGRQWATDSAGNIISDTTVPFIYRSKEETTSENHPYWNILNRGGAPWEGDPRLQRAKHALRGRDIGGPFSNYKRWHWLSHPDAYVGNPGVGIIRRFYDGPLAAWSQNNGLASNDGQWPAYPVHSVSELNSLGTIAIAATIPTNPVASLATLLGEIRNDGLPSIPGTLAARAILKRRAAVASLGKEFLNVTFGLVPTINDTQKVARAVQESAKIIEQFERDSGRRVRRRLDFPDQRTITSTVLSTNATPRPGFSGNQVLSSGTLTRTVETHTRTWFSACYTYYLDPGITAKGKLKRQEQIANKLLGSRINPEVLWELTPWSWAVDWVTNIGEIMTNLSALSSDSLVMRYAYIMRTTRVTHTYTLTGCRLYGGVEGPFVQRYVVETKTRQKATPYGFGLDPSMFSTRQWAILAALGVSRGSI